MSNIYEAPKADLTKEYKQGTELQITGGMLDGLEKGAKWAKILAFIGYVATGFIVIGAILAFLFTDGVIGIVLFAVYALGAFVFYKLSRFAHQYSTSVSHLLDSHDVYDLVEAQEYFRQYTKWTAVIMLIAMVFGLGAGAYVAANS